MNNEDKIKTMHFKDGITFDSESLHEHYVITNEIELLKEQAKGSAKDFKDKIHMQELTRQELTRNIESGQVTMDFQC